MKITRSRTNSRIKPRHCFNVMIKNIGLCFYNQFNCTTKPYVGYAFLSSKVLLKPELIQQVAGEGMNLPDELKTKYFPGKRNWEQ